MISDGLAQLISRTQENPVVERTADLVRLADGTTFAPDFYDGLLRTIAREAKSGDSDRDGN